MEQNQLTTSAKKLWTLILVTLFIFKKNLSKRKLLLDLNLLIKRGKLTLHNFALHCAAVGSAVSTSNRRKPTTYPLSLFAGHKKHDKKTKVSLDENKDDKIFVDPAVIRALEMLTTAAAVSEPVVCGFGKSPAVRQLRVTDSPFPLCNGEEDSYVDDDAEKFIMKFYSLRRDG